jgi:lipopolysaccharide transport system permease protein
MFDLIIEPGRAERNYWTDLWRYRELFYFLAWRDILVRYKETVIGIAWALIRPLLTMVVFTVVFGKIAKVQSEGVPNPPLVFAAMQNLSVLGANSASAWTSAENQGAI